MLVLEISRDFAILTSLGGWEVCDNCAEIVLVDSAVVAEGEGVALYVVDDRLPDVHDSPAFLHTTVGFFFGEVQIENLFCATVGLVDVDKALGRIVSHCEVWALLRGWNLLLGCSW